jgi:hypothetical protein
MIGIIRKNAPFYLVYTLFFIAVPTVMWGLNMERGLRTPIAVMNSFFMFFAVVVPALSAEAIEEKYRSYPFLMTLPLKLETIVRAKMALPVMATALTVAYNFILFHVFESVPPVLGDCVKIILLNAAVTLVLAGIVFVFMYRLNVRMLMMGLVFAGVFFNLLGLIAFRIGGAVNIFSWPELIVAGRPVWLFALLPFVAMGIYHLFFLQAVRLKQERMFD